MKLGIGIPLINDRVHNQFFVSFYGMRKPDHHLFVPRFPEAFAESIAKVRNDLVTQALEVGCTHLLMCDTDQVYPEDTIEKMLRHDKPAVGALVHRRWPPFEPICNRGEIGQYKHVSDEEVFSGELIEVDATGTGCILFQTWIFDKVDQPWFQLRTGKDGNPIGEDIHFCSALRDLDIPIHVDTSAFVGHLSTVMIERNWYEIYKIAKGAEWRK